MFLRKISIAPCLLSCVLQYDIYLTARDSSSRTSRASRACCITGLNSNVLINPSVKENKHQQIPLFSAPAYIYIYINIDIFFQTQNHTLFVTNPFLFSHAYMTLYNSLQFNTAINTLYSPIGAYFTRAKSTIFFLPYSLCPSFSYFFQTFLEST